jgi:hypothetical protein
MRRSRAASSRRLRAEARSQPSSQTKLMLALEETSQVCSLEPASMSAAQLAATPSSHSASDSDSASPMTGQSRLLPLLERAGVAPSSHSGSEPSAQAKDPLLSRAGALPFSQVAATTVGIVPLGALASVCLPRCLLAWRALPLCEDGAHVWVPCFALRCGQASLCVCASVCEGPSSAATSTARNTANVRAEAKRRVDELRSKAIVAEGGGDLLAHRRRAVRARACARSLDEVGNTNSCSVRAGV